MSPSIWDLAAAQLDTQTEQSRWALDPVKWVVDQLGAEPDDWQAEALTALGQGKNVAVRSGHGVGKTAFLAWTVLWWLDTKPYSKVPCAAPTEHQLNDHLWPEMSVWLSRSQAGLNERIIWKATRVFVQGRERTSFAVIRAAGPDNKPENLAGFHADHLLFLVDEASGVADRNMTVVTGALTTEGAQLCMTGNPTRSTGYFAKRFARGESKNWFIKTISSRDSKRVSKEWAEEVANEWGRESDEYRVRVLGLPPRGDARGFIPPELVEVAQSRTLPFQGPLYIGVDVARYGADKTVLAPRRGGAVGKLRSYSKLSNPDVAQKCLDLVDELVPPGSEETVRILVDDDGVGGGVSDLLQLASRNRPPGSARLNVSGVSFGGAGNRWYTTNAGVWWARMRRLMQDDQLSLPEGDRLYTQLTDRISSMNMKGKTVLESKDHMRDRGVPSPDEADAVALTLADIGIGSGFLEYWKSSAIATTDDVARLKHFVIDGPLNEDEDSPRQSQLVAPLTKVVRCPHFFGPPAIDDGSRRCINCTLTPDEAAREDELAASSPD